MVKALKPKRPKLLDLGSQDSKGRFTKGNKYAIKPGERRNPGGRPPSVSLSAAFKQKLAQICDDRELNPTQQLTWAQVIANGMVLQAALGKVPAAKELRESTEGSTINVQGNWKQACIDLGVDPKDAMSQLIERIEENLDNPHTN